MKVNTLTRQEAVSLVKNAFSFVKIGHFGRLGQFLLVTQSVMNDGYCIVKLINFENLTKNSLLLVGVMN